MHMFRLWVHLYKYKTKPEPEIVKKTREGTRSGKTTNVEDLTKRRKSPFITNSGHKETD